VYVELKAEANFKKEGHDMVVGHLVNEKQRIATKALNSV
jgi:hypothetical protein